MILIVSILTAGVALTIDAKKPLVGSTTAQFNLGFPGPQTEIPVWIGHITIDGEIYGIAFFNVGSGKPFDDGWKGTTVFFGEVWVIYDTININFENGVLVSWNHGDILLWGTFEGIVTTSNSKFLIDGTVEEAFDSFSIWTGRHVHMSGTLEFYPFGAPQYAFGTFQIN